MEEQVLLTIYIAIIILILAVLFILLYLHFGFYHRSRQLRKKLKEIEPRLSQEPLDVLKEKYLKIYTLYLKVSEKEKRNFYALISRLRESIEEKLQADKKLEELCQKAGQGSLAERKKTLEEIQKLIQTLPEKAKEKYFSEMKQLEEQLEQGKSSS